MSEGKQRDLFDYLQWLFTLLIAIGGFYLNMQQSELKKGQLALEKQQAAIDVRSQRERMIQLFADKTFSYIDKMGIEDADRQDVLIELVDIITEINISETGEVDEQDKANYNEQKSLIPLRLALVTGNDDILTHITTSNEKQKLWVKFAEKSSNDTVRNTAIRALGQIYRHADEVNNGSEKDSEHHDYKFAIQKILSIAGDLADDTIRASAAQAIVDIEQAIIRSENLPSLGESDDNALIALVSKAKISLRLQEVGNLRSVTSSMTQASSPADMEEEKRTTQQSLARTEATLQLLAPSGGIEVVYEGEPSEVLNDKTREVIEGLIGDLTSDETEKRRAARAKLIEHGNEAVGPMLDAVMKTDPKNRYRVELGVVYVLYKMKQPIRVPKNKNSAKALIGLIGADQSDIRKYASEFLMKLYDKQSLEVVYDELQAVIEKERQNGNKLYNAVVVLGTWMRILPSQSVSQRESIRNDLTHLRKQLMANETEWKHTLRLIDEMLG